MWKEATVLRQRSLIHGKGWAPATRYGHCWGSGRGVAFAAISPALLRFPAESPTQKALVSRLWGWFRGFVSFSSLDQTCSCARCKDFGLIVWFLFFFLKKPTQNRSSTKQSSFYSLCLLHTEALSVYICPIPHSEDYYFLLPSFPNLFVYSHIFLA